MSSPLQDVLDSRVDICLYVYVYVYVCVCVTNDI